MVPSSYSSYHDKMVFDNDNDKKKTMKTRFGLCGISLCISFAILAIWIGGGNKGNDKMNLVLLQNDDKNLFKALTRSAFDEEMYHILQHPYGEFDCLAHNIHLSQATDVEVDHAHHVNMTVSFTLDREHCAETIPIVYYGHDGTWERNQVRALSPLQFNYTSPATKEYFQSDWIHHVILPNLIANQKYWYQIKVFSSKTKTTTSSSSLLRGSSMMIAHSSVMTFSTPPLPGTPTTMAIVGDLGQTTNSTLTMKHIYRAVMQPPKHDDPPVTLLTIVGDMSYADTDSHRWTSWMTLMEPLLRSVPMEVIPGNHEIECDLNTREIFVAYEHYFSNANRLGPAETLPVNETYRKSLWRQSCNNPSNFIGTYDYGNAFYTFTHGLVKMIMLSSYSHTEKGSIQYEWLDQVLQNVNRSQTPWIVVTFHCPLYTTFLGHNNESQSFVMKQHMEPLFVKYGVNLVFSGHDHAYMRTRPLAFGQVTEGAPVYLTVGAGGNREQHSSGYVNPDHAEEWVAKRDKFEYGYGHFHVPNATHAHFRWVRDGTTKEGIQDCIWFENPHVQ